MHLKSGLNKKEKQLGKIKATTSGSKTCIEKETTTTTTTPATQYGHTTDKIAHVEKPPD